MPPQDEEVRIAALGTAADYYLARGVTWVQDAWVRTGRRSTTYIEAARRGALRMRFNLALYGRPPHFESQVEHFSKVKRRVDQLGSPMLTANTVKSSPTAWSRTRPARSARALLFGLHDHGMTVWEGDSLSEAARQIDDLGLQIHIPRHR
jgi:predicted amidohydrolase YtcJ